MAQLSDLPNELLCEIIGHVMPEDIESFAQTSKHIRSVFGSTLEEHRRNIRKYWLFFGLATPETVEPLLKDVLANPRIGRYVEFVELYGVPREDLGVFWGSEREKWAGFGSVKNGIGTSGEELSLQQIHAAVNESKLLDPGHLNEARQQVDKGEKDILLALLLPLLPNLKFLLVARRRRWRNLCQLPAMIERVKKLDAHFLSKLKGIHIGPHLLARSGAWADRSYEGFSASVWRPGPLGPWSMYSVDD